MTYDTTPNGLLEVPDTEPVAFGIQGLDVSNQPNGVWMRAESGNDFKTDDLDHACKVASKLRTDGARVRVCRYPL